MAVVPLVFTAVSAYAWPTVFATGTTLYDSERAHNGYMLFTPMDFTPPTDKSFNSDGNLKNTRAVLLIDMKGSIVHVWEMPFDPLFGELLPNGHLVTMEYHGKSEYTIPGTGGKIVEFDWDGKRVFEHEDLSMHHDFARLPNGNYLYLAFEQLPKALQAKVRGGIKGSELPGGIMLSERVVEVNRKGEVVWEWKASAHLDPDIDIIGPHYTREEWLHGNSIEVLSDGNIVVCNRQTDSVILIDKKSGRILQRWGSPTYLDKKTGRIDYQNMQNQAQFLGGPHDVRQIPAGYPGAGNLTIYDNGLYSGVSRSVEIDPKTGQLVWFWNQPGLGRKQFSFFTGSAQRLRNGNTLLCNGANGQFVQVTPENEVVWEYINPYTPSKRFQGSVLKVDLYEPNYCPQFKTLPPTKSAAIEPPKNKDFRVPKSLPASVNNSDKAAPLDSNRVKLWGDTARVALSLCVSVIVSFLAGWHFARRLQHS